MKISNIVQFSGRSGMAATVLTLVLPAMSRGQAVTAETEQFVNSLRTCTPDSFSHTAEGVTVARPGVSFGGGRCGSGDDGVVASFAEAVVQ